MFRKNGVAFALLTLAVPMLLFGRSVGTDNAGLVLGGTADAPVVIEVFSDFQCPACRQLYMSTIRPTLREYSSKGEVGVIYQEFPLAMHKYAREAARYAEAAYRLDRAKWLPVVDSIFENAPSWSQDGDFDAALARVLSAEDFLKVKRMAQQPDIEASIERQIALGQIRQVKATPTMFVRYAGGEQKVEGGVAYPVLKQFIDRVIH